MGNERVRLGPGRRRISRTCRRGGDTVRVALNLLAVPFLVASLQSGLGCRPSDGRQPAADPKAGPGLRIGYMICDSLQETRARFGPLTAYLAERTGLPITAVYLDTDEVPAAFERGELDITHTNSLLYVIMHERGLLPLAGEKRGSMGFRSAGGIAVRKDSPIRSLADLKGRRMVFGPMMAPTGYLSQYVLLQEAGVDPELDLAYYAIPSGSHKHEKVVYGVWLGAYDAAAVPMLDVELMIAQGRLGPDDLRIVAVGEPIPYCVFGVSPKVGPPAADAVRGALLNLTADVTVPVGGEVLAVLAAAGLDGFVPISDADFDRVREMARKANMPPYQRF